MKKTGEAGVDSPSVIHLTKGVVATIDLADLPLVQAHSWHLSSRGYAAARIRGRIVLMHRLIMGLESGQFSDHVNGIKTDNRRANLRIVTCQQNSFNTRSHRDSTSRFKGVFWVKARKRWQAAITVAGRRVHLGTFTDEFAAAMAYDRAAAQRCGEFARLNFPASTGV